MCTAIKDEGPTTRPFGVTVLNDLGRFRLVIDTTSRLRQIGDQGIYLKQQLMDKLITQTQYIDCTVWTFRKFVTGIGS